MGISITLSCLNLSCSIHVAPLHYTQTKCMHAGVLWFHYSPHILAIVHVEGYNIATQDYASIHLSVHVSTGRGMVP